jgi:two-component system cell cycle response regulator DivK
MSGAGKTVLVVEDDALSRKLFEDVLRAHNYCVQSASDVPSAMTSLAGCRPDLILLDIRLPQVDGRQLLQMIKKDALLQSIPVLAVSAYLGPADKHMFILLGAADLIIKPFPIDDLISAVASLT